MQGEGGRQYHIGLAPGELAPNIVVCGDPARAERFAAAHLQQVRVERRHREYVTFTGERAGVSISVMATGMGADNTEIAMVEISALVEHPTIVRMGSSGALQPHIGLGDLVISTGAVRMESTSTAYVPEGYPAIADLEVVLALRDACRAAEVPHHVGLTATAAGFYGAQGRSVGPFRARRPEVLDELARCRVANLEMETSALLTMAMLAGWRAGALCAVYANRTSDAALDAQGRDEAETRCMAAVADAMVRLAT